MRFDNLLNEYLFRIRALDAKKSRGLISEDHFYECYYSLWSFFSSLKEYCEDFPTITRHRTNQDEQVGIFTYRGIDFPIFLDDYGQQYYINYNNHEFSSGSYNSIPEFELSDQLDKYLDFNEF